MQEKGPYANSESPGQPAHQTAPSLIMAFYIPWVWFTDLRNKMPWSDWVQLQVYRLNKMPWSDWVQLQVYRFKE